MHLWTSQSYSPANEAYAAGVSIPEPIMDGFAAMRFAELLHTGKAHAAIEAALESGNFGCDCLRMHAAALLDFIADFEVRRSASAHPHPSSHRSDS
ncbi:MAG: hypothetical protein IT473_05175 [Lysobacter sp.]|nr:hypothetical protein [Lysobacter sp.]